MPPETAAQLFAIAFPPERTPGELLTIGEVEDWHGRLHEAVVPGDVVDAWSEAKGALLALVIALAGSVRADEVGVEQPHGGKPAGVIEPEQAQRREWSFDELLELVDGDDDVLAGVWPRDVERARRASCTCDQLDPRAIQGGANCDTCHAADQVLQRIAAEVRS